LYTVQQVIKLLGVTAPVVTDHLVEYLLIDSRSAFSPAHSLFFAITTPRRNGHDYIGGLYQKGVRSFVITQQVDTASFPGANFIKVKDSVAALQQLAAAHRSQFSIPVIAITGSNGKTIVKEWLFQLLQPDFKIVRSPKSFNSQLGVPLSVWQMKSHHDLAIFEAGISQPGEMERLEKVIQPTIGILTNIGDAHREGFLSQDQKEQEKRKLFVGASLPPSLTLLSIASTKLGTAITAKGSLLAAGGTIEIPFTDAASIQNALRCWELLLLLKIPQSTIMERMRGLTAVDMRLSLKKGVQHCQLINDSYSADLSSLEIALSFLKQQAGSLKRTVILSDFMQTGEKPSELYARIQALLEQVPIARLITIGPSIGAALSATSSLWQLEQYSDTASFLSQVQLRSFRDEIILIKGARSFGLEQVVAILEEKVHETRLEIDLQAVVHNYNQYRQHIKPDTKIMAMVKAFAYGSGATEIAHVLQFQGVDYFGVAYADEGVELRKAGITTPIMVMNTEPAAFETLLTYQLEPALYSVALLDSFDQFLQQQGITNYPIHLEIETGMNRLGLTEAEWPLVIKRLTSTASFLIQSVFSHLAASEDAAADSFTNEQFAVYNSFIRLLTSEVDARFIRHIANSAGAIRHPSLVMDMVRVGIGLYGIEKSSLLTLKPAITFRSTIAQIKIIPAGSGVSYNRKTVVERPTRLATVRVGYADGYPRSLGNRKGYVWVQEKLAPILGTVCMDMFMIDVTDIPTAQVGDEVILFGKELPVEQVAHWATTIPYEILTGISQRVKRVYFQD